MKSLEADEKKKLARELKNLAIFKGVAASPLLLSMIDLLSAEGEEAQTEAACRLVSVLYPEGADLTENVLKTVLEDDNFYARASALGYDVASEVEERATYELSILRKAASVLPGDFREGRESAEDSGEDSFGRFPAWRTSDTDFISAYRKATGEAYRRGLGIFSSAHVFILEEGGKLRAAVSADPQSLETLYGYERERGEVIRNTEALLRGAPAQNMLLYGDAGTGKSGTIKAVANRYAPEGLRLVQVSKSLIREIPGLLDRLANEPTKFIIFIDDLSFSSGDRDFMALKTVLEGSVSVRPANTVIYATSNRRHLVKENIADRSGSDVHASDSMEEVASLSARFGLLVTFLRPDREEYLEIVDMFAKSFNIDIPKEELHRDAEKFALRAGGRSPRAAKQYMDYILTQ